MSNWTLFSNHGHVLVCLMRDSEVRLRDVAADVGITERAVQKIVRDLQDSGMITVTKHGRRNLYRIHRRVSMRHDLEAHCTVGDLMRFVLAKTDARQTLLEKGSQAEKPKREDIRPTGEQTTQSIMEENTTESQQTAPRSSRSTRGVPGLEKSQIEKARPKQSEKKQPGDAKPEEIHPIERQQRSLF